MARVWTNNAGLELNATNLNALEGDVAAAVQKWRPNYPYTSGTLVLSPAGEIVAAKTTFTSGATYDATKWALTTAASALASRVTSLEGANTSLTSLTNRVTAVETKNTAQDGRLTALEAGSGGGGTVVVQTGSGLDTAKRPLIGLRVGVGSINQGSLPDNQYFDELHRLETDANTKADLSNWYRSISATSAADFTATVKAELLAYPYRSVVYAMEGLPNNSQLNKDFSTQSGSWVYLRDTLLAIKDSGVADRVILAPMHEGNGGGGTPGSIGAYAWQMYDTTTATFDGVANTRLNTPAKYKQAFRSIVTLARSLGVTSKFAQWFLAANTSDATLVDGIERMDMSPGYAGDDYVDIIGLSYYNRSGDPRPQYSDTWPDPGGNGLREFYNSLERFTKNPLWLCETGCAPSNQYGDQAKWYTDLVKLAASNELPRLEGVVMFMQDSRKFDGVDGAVSAGANMKLDSPLDTPLVGTTAEKAKQLALQQAKVVSGKKLLGRTMNAVRRTNKITPVPSLNRQLFPASVADLTTLKLWDKTVGVTLAIGPQYRGDGDLMTNGMRITKPAYTTGDDSTSYTAYREMSKDYIDYNPNDPYCLSFWARSEFDGFRIEAGIRVDGGSASKIGDELVISDVFEQYIVPFSGVTNDPLYNNWRMPNFCFGNNKNTAATWLDIYNLSLVRGSVAQANALRLVRPKCISRPEPFPAR